MIAFVIVGAFLVGLAIDQKGDPDTVRAARRGEALLAVACFVVAWMLHLAGCRS